MDFAEDTPDRKRTFQGTAMSIYQSSDPEDKMHDLNVDTPDQSRSIRELMIQLQASWNALHLLRSQCMGPVYPRFSLFAEDVLPIRVRIQYFAWLLGRSLT